MHWYYLTKGGAQLGFNDYLGLTITERKILLAIHDHVLEQEKKAVENPK